MQTTEIYCTKSSVKYKVSRALFLFADIHQGDERFSIYSRGKQLHLMSY